MDESREDAIDQGQEAQSGQERAPAKPRRVARLGSVTAALAVLGMAADDRFEDPEGDDAIARRIILGDGSKPRGLAEQYADPKGDTRVEGAILEKRFAPGGTMTAADGTNYTIKRINRQGRGIHETLTLERTFPKVKGKAAKKALKKQQRAARARIQQLSNQEHVDDQPQ